MPLLAESPEAPAFAIRRRHGYGGTSGYGAASSPKSVEVYGSKSESALNEITLIVLESRRFVPGADYDSGR